MSKVSRFATVAAVAFGLSISTGASASFLVTENFSTNSDGRWEGHNNRVDGPPVQNYGWSGTDNTGTSVNPAIGTATPDGEMGGLHSRQDSPAHFYGFNIGTIDLNEPFEAQGVVHRVTGAASYNFGFFRGAESFGTGGDPANFVGFLLDDGFDPYALVATRTGGRDRTRATANVGTIPVGQTVPIGMAYDPAGNGGAGTLTLHLNGNQHVHNLGVNKTDLDALTHFGIFGTSAMGGGGTIETYYDDLTFSSENAIPEPASLGLLGAAGLMMIRRRRSV